MTVIRGVFKSIYAPYVRGSYIGAGGYFLFNHTFYLTRSPVTSFVFRLEPANIKLRRKSQAPGPFRLPGMDDMSLFFESSSDSDDSSFFSDSDDSSFFSDSDDDDLTLVSSSSGGIYLASRRRGNHKHGNEGERSSRGHGEHKSTRHWADGTAVRDERLWPRDKHHLNVRFLDGEPEDKQLVENVVVKYYHTIPMSIRFRFLRSNDTRSSDIRITFVRSGSSSSCVGRWSEEVAMNKPTMELNINHNDASKKQADILHEFGHALGLEHEHTHPDCKIRFNRPVVMEKRNLNDERFNRNYEKSSVIIGRTTPYDVDSIMHYPVEKWETMSLTTDIPLNTVLSRGDRKLLMSLYPIESEPEPKVPEPVVVARPTPTTIVEKPQRKITYKPQPVYISGSGSHTVQGGYVVIRGSGSVTINGDSEVDIRGSGSVLLNGNGIVRKRGSGSLAVNGNCMLEASGSGSVYVRGTGTAKVTGSVSVYFSDGYRRWVD
ncbi:hypothetical protein K445DRAFT_13967 [Daldinia sp. EC12]|nr:hypothetical protein K445DRAFT_13967 [Daldinia sp. EC12]